MQPHEEAKRLRIHQALARQIGIAIVSGEHPPGYGFGAEIEEAQALGVSRTAYREAMRILTAKGLLESRPKAGTRVTLRSRWNVLDPDILAWMFSSDHSDERFVRDLFELRGLIEPAAAAWAATRRSPEQLEKMRAALEAMARYGLSMESGREADQRFHGAILEASDNEPLASLSSSVGAALTWTTRFKQMKFAHPRDPIGEHEAVFAAIAARDADGARSAMTELLRLALDDMGLSSIRS